MSERFKLKEVGDHQLWRFAPGSTCELVAMPGEKVRGYTIPRGYIGLRFLFGLDREALMEGERSLHFAHRWDQLEPLDPGAIKALKKIYEDPELHGVVTPNKEVI